MSARWPIFLALLIVLTAGCTASRGPDLERLYASARQGGTEPVPVILIHGVLGSRLSDARSGVEVWPGSFTDLLFSDFTELALEFDPQTLEPLPDPLVPSGIFDRAAGQDFYGAIIETLERAGGYVPGHLGRKPAPGRRQYYLFLYDWRQDNLQAVRALDALIEEIRRDYADPRLEVDLVAHSNGGLIARYYARYGTVDLLDGNDFPVTWAGAERIRRLILLGTPNFGSVRALTGFIEGTRIGLGRIPPEVLASFPSGYQLFPHALNEWLIGSRGQPLDRDLFDVEIWRRFQWSIFDPRVRQRIVEERGGGADGDRYLAAFERYFERRLERARRFTWSLSVATPEPELRPIVFGGDCELTPARLLVEEIRGESVLRLWPSQIRHAVPGIDYDALMLEPGDGTVTKASLLARSALDPSRPRHRYVDFPLAFSFLLCERHDRLTGNVSFQDNLLHALLSVDLP